MSPASPEPRRTSPGALRSRTTLQVQTRKAHALVRGRRAEGGKPAIIGLVRFATLLGPIYAAAAQDDPYADWWLLRVERELLQGRAELESLRAHVEESLRSRPVVEVEVAHCLEPVEVDLSFRNPYGFMGAYLLADYDELVLAVLTAKHVGLFGRQDAERLMEDAGRVVRRAYQAAFGFRYLALSREDLRQGTQKGQRARELLGELPQEVLEGSLRAEHAPAIQYLGELPIPAPAEGEDEHAETLEEAGAGGKW